MAHLEHLGGDKIHSKDTEDTTMRLPNMPTMVPAPAPDAPIVHWRWPHTEPTECGLRVAGSTVSTWSVTCRACLAALGVEVDDRTPEQQERDLAGALWRMETHGPS